MRAGEIEGFGDLAEHAMLDIEEHGGSAGTAAVVREPSHRGAATPEADLEIRSGADDVDAIEAVPIAGLNGDR